MGSILVLGPMIISSILNQQASLAVNNISTLVEKVRKYVARSFVKYVLTLC